MTKNNAPVTTNYADYGFDEDDFAVNDRIPSGQWLNPSISSPIFGLAVKLEQSEIIGLKEGSGWEQKTYTFESGDTEDFLISTTPRLIILNGAATIANNIKGNAQQLYMTRWEDNKPVETLLYNKQFAGIDGYQPWGYIVMLAVDENNNPLCKPFRLKTGKACVLGMKNLYEKEFKPKFLEVYQAATGKRLPPGQLPTCKFMSHAIFEPILTVGKQVSKKNGKSSMACQANSMKPLTVERFGEFALSPKHPTSLVVSEYMANILDYTKLEVAETPQVIASAPVDPETGEIKVSPEVLAKLAEDPDCPF